MLSSRVASAVFRGGRECDRAGGGEALDLGRRHADLAEDLGGVLAEQWRGPADRRPAWRRRAPGKVSIRAVP